MLIQIAINLNIADAISLLRENLQEEEEMFLDGLERYIYYIFIKLWPRLRI
jgi:hypothetical protein